MMGVWPAVACGGAVGALGRWLLPHSLQDSRLGAWPAGLRSVNASGCLVAGFLIAAIAGRLALPPLWREALSLGALGAFTTFSGVTLDMMGVWPAVACGVAVGALGRWLLPHSLQDSRLGALPAGLLRVNASGCLVAGFLFAAIAGRLALPPLWRGALSLGALGAFTTFSGVTLAWWRLLQDSGLGLAMAQLLLNVTLCLAATLGGISWARSLG